jgi:UDP-N-acetylmuramyl pentapeptide synthase
MVRAHTVRDTTLLVKGSRFMQMERVVAALEAHGENDATRTEKAQP